MVKTLKAIIENYGINILRDGRILLAYYADLAPKQVREYKMLESLVKCNGNIELLEAVQCTPPEQVAQFKNVMDRLESQFLISPEMAFDICSLYWNALGMPEMEKQEFIPTMTSIVTGNKKGNTEEAHVNAIKSREELIVSRKLVLSVIAVLTMLIICASALAMSKGKKTEQPEPTGSNDQTKSPLSQQEQSNDSNQDINTGVSGSSYFKRLDSIYMRYDGEEYSFAELNYDDNTGFLNHISYSERYFLNYSVEIDFTYDENLRLTDIDAQGYGETKTQFDYAFEYDDDGNLIRWVFARSKENETHDLSYDENGRLMREDVYIDYLRADDLVYYEEYFYDDFGDLVRSDTYFDNNPVPSTTYYEYDRYGNTSEIGERVYTYYRDFVIYRTQGVSHKEGFYSPKGIGEHQYRLIDLLVEYLGFSGETSDMKFDEAGYLMSFSFKDEFPENPIFVEMNYVNEPEK